MGAGQESLFSARRLSFVVEFVNVQPDAEGNPANHIDRVWRDETGDFR